jgi:predicted DNA-binding WGR domain protein
MIKLELVEGAHKKFWLAEVQQTTLVVRFGRIGTTGQTQVKAFLLASQAQRECQKKMQEKRRKGYREVLPSDEDRLQVALPSARAAVVSAAPQGLWARLMAWLFGPPAQPEIKLMLPEVGPAPRCHFCGQLSMAGAAKCGGCGAKA